MEEKLEQGMRIIRLERGKYKGSYIYYEEWKFREKFPEIPLIVWGTKECESVKKDDWVIAEDGIVLQVLNVTRAETKYQVAHFIRFATYTVPIVWNKNNGKTYWRTLKGTAPYYKKNAVTQPYGKNAVYTIKDVYIYYFAYLIMQGYAPKVALVIIQDMMVGRKFLQGRFIVERKTKELLLHPITLGVFMEHLNPFFKELNNQITDEDLIKELKSAMNECKKGSKEHLAVIEKVIELKQKSMTFNNINPGNQLPANSQGEVKQIEEAKVIDNIPPPNI